VSAGRDTSTLPKKLGLGGEIVFTVRHAPAGFAEKVAADGGTGDAIWQQSLLAPLDLVIAFHARHDLLVADWPKLIAPLAPDGAVWVAWPKPTSGVDTDLTADALRAAVLPTGWVDDKACSIDDTWSALRFVRRQEQKRPKDAAKERQRAKRGR
jgi:hypothetical protein